MTTALLPLYLLLYCLVGPASALVVGLLFAMRGVAVDPMEWALYVSRGHEGSLYRSLQRATWTRLPEGSMVKTILQQALYLLSWPIWLHLDLRSAARYIEDKSR